ncbi:general transcription factor 3C polypeptide 3 isoform X2 [Macadamia integrifolia]|uniref:general transcription factor 3C polypeptide 3 isoform X2 n=1 Tax=Macadamia integrifolia TaxID=60698 RepID=UPI001C4E6AE5|nr:general transcription factor 3C polypeptide 3 isoform X2 [Macadamia integrifolia]
MGEEKAETSGLQEAEVSVSASGMNLERDAEVVEEEEDGEEEEEEEEDNDEEGEEDIEDGEYTLRFEGEMDPLDFTEDDAYGIQPYQQFERLEYEALAEKKRKALAQSQRDGSAKKPRQEMLGASIAEIMEVMNYGMRRKSRKPRKRGRRKGSKNKLSPEVTRKLGDATLHYAFGRYEEAISVLKEVVRLAPNLPDSYHTLGLVYNAIGDKKKALNFYMISAHLTPKDPSLWKLLFTWSIEQGNTGQARYCLSKAITADPEDINLRFDRALLHIELGDYQKAAESYEQILKRRPENVEALKMAAKMYQKCGQDERAVRILEDYLKDHQTQIDLDVANLLVAIHMKNNAHAEALQQIEHARLVYNRGEEFPLYLNVKAGICEVHLGNLDKAEIIFRDLQKEHTDDHPKLISDVADSFMNLGQYESALKYYFLLEANGGNDHGFLHFKIAQCYLSLNKRVQAIPFFQRGLHSMEGNIDARLTLASLLLEEEREDEAILLLSPPKNSESIVDKNSTQSTHWWLNGKIKKLLARIYHARGMLEEFVNAIFSSVRETLFIETINQKVRNRKRLPRSVLLERLKKGLGDRQADTDTVFHGFRPLAAASDLSKAARAKKSLQKKAALKEEKKAAALAAGLDWQSDDSDDEPVEQAREPPLPNLLKDEEHYQLILDLSRALSSLRMYWEALEIINHTLRLAYNTLSVEKKEELRSLGAQIAYNTTNPTHGYDCARYIVQQHPYSFAAWNCYYKVISRKPCITLLEHVITLDLLHLLCHIMRKCWQFVRRITLSQSFLMRNQALQKFRSQVIVTFAERLHTICT